jgi:hypothetical protein
VCAVNRLHKGTRNRVRPFRNGTREKKRRFFRTRKSVPLMLLRLARKRTPGKKQAGTEAENVGPLRKELFSEMCNAARPWSWRHTVKLSNLKTSPVALTWFQLRQTSTVIKFRKIFGRLTIFGRRPFSRTRSHELGARASLFTLISRPPGPRDRRTCRGN